HTARGAEDRNGVRSTHSTLRRESRSHGDGADRNTQPAQEEEDQGQTGISFLVKAVYQFYSDSLGSVSRSSRYVMYRSCWAIRSRNALFSASACASRASNRAAKYRLCRCIMNAGRFKRSAIM